MTTRNDYCYYSFALVQARSSGGERYLDTVEVGGSRPPAPTILAADSVGASIGSMPFLFHELCCHVVQIPDSAVIPIYGKRLIRDIECQQ